MSEDIIQYSVVVSIYNSENSLKLLQERLSAVFNSLNSSWELILVNDCSRDRSWDVCMELASRSDRVTAINLANNFGQHAAAMCGFSYASGDYIITMDDDLQHPPEEIIKLIKAIKDGSFSVVYGQYDRRKYKWFKNICSIALNKLISEIISSGYIATTFRILKKSVIKKLINFGQCNVIVDVLIKDIVNKRDIGKVKVKHHEREIGHSSYSYTKLFIHAFNMIFNYTVWPLRLATMAGLALSLLSILLAIYYFIDYFIKQVPIAGFTTLIFIMTFLFGITLFVLGIVGEYVGRIFLNINQKPQFSVKEIYKNGKYVV